MCKKIEHGRHNQLNRGVKLTRSEIGGNLECRNFARMGAGSAVRRDGVRTPPPAPGHDPKTPLHWEIEINWVHSLVGAVNIVNGQDGQVAVVTEVTQGDAGTGLELVVVDDLLADVEGDGHGEDVAIGKAAVLADAMHTPSVYFLFGGHSNRIIRTYRS